MKFESKHWIKCQTRIWIWKYCLQNVYYVSCFQCVNIDAQCCHRGVMIRVPHDMIRISIQGSRYNTYLDTYLNTVRCQRDVMSSMNADTPVIRSTAYNLLLEWSTYYYNCRWLNQNVTLLSYIRVFPYVAIWWHETWSRLFQVMAWCLMAPSHYLSQFWIIISEVQWHSSEGNFARDTSAINHWNYLENYFSKISFKSPRGQWAKWACWWSHISE